jgi:uncharacterized protein (TIGR02145 family)
MGYKTVILSTILLFSVGLTGLQAQSTQQPQKKIALVIGNGNYSSGILANPENDARSMTGVLRRLGFTVYPYENLNAGQMKKAIDDFGLKQKGNTVGLFYYAGHGIQAKGYNYLIPVDAVLKTEEQVEYDCIRADRILSLMETSGTTINIIILDACRNNPFERSWTRSATGKGLAFMSAPRGTLIAYATAPGNTASDGAGQNGLYTSAILESIQIPDINVIQMFQNVRNIVSQKSGNNQIPWESTSLTGDFYFNSTGVVIIEPHDSVKTELAKQTRDNGYSGLLIDSRDNRQYKTVTIGNQVWMAENLNYDSGEGSWTYGNNSVSALVYGRLYNWLTAKLVCPSGWHLPDNKEWSTLSTYLGGDSVAGGKLKETGTKHWESPNTGATNETGFAALPGGIRYDDGEFRFIWTKSEWWSASDTIYDSSYNSDLNAYSVSTFYHKGIIYKDLGLKKFGYSVRCIKD